MNCAAFVNVGSLPPFAAFSTKVGSGPFSILEGDLSKVWKTRTGVIRASLKFA